jgi:NAD(P)-dependent dehydrogenase (short-subunit alcohol dehydrogenase family)
MARVFITGASTGLGRIAAHSSSLESGRVVMHARNEGRGEEALAVVPSAETVVIGDPRLMIVNRMGVPESPDQFTWT